MKKKLLRSLLLLFVALLSSTNALAYVKINGIYYNLNYSTKEATVTYKTTEYLTDSDGNWYKDDYAGYVYIPSTVTYNSVTYKVTSIGEAAFELCRGLTSVDIDCTNLKSIEGWAFWRCKNLKEVDFGKQDLNNNTFTIGESAFMLCSRLEYFDIHNDLTSIGKDAFSGCISLENVEFSHKSKLEVIGEHAFFNCPSLININLPPSLRQMSRLAFDGCTALKTVALPIQTEVVVDGNFGDLIIWYNSTNFIRYYSDEQDLYDYIQADHPNLVSGDYTTTFTKATFFNGELRNRQNVTSLTVPSTVTRIGARAFEYNTLSSISLPNSITSIGEEAFAYSRLGQVILPNSLSVIPKHAFLESSLWNLTIPNSVQTIENGAFSHCRNLQEVTIPYSVSSIDKYAFDSSIQHVYVERLAPPTLGSKFSTTTTIHVPKGRTEQYNNAENWAGSTFKENLFYLEDETEVDVTISSARWSTLILPFDAEIPEHMEVFVLYDWNVDEEDDTVLPYPTTKILANKPYMVKAEPGTYHFSGMASAWNETYWWDDNERNLLGSYVELDVPEKAFILARVNGVVGFYRVTGDNVGKTKIAPFHCYYQPMLYTWNNSKSDVLFIEDYDVTGISDINSDNVQPATGRYNLNGQRVNDDAKGIVIENGKKILIRK